MSTFTIVSLLSLVLAVTGQDWSSSICKNLPENPTGYTRKENADKSLRADDDFAIQSVCTHNKFRQEAAGLGAVKWNAALASFASKWTTKLKDELGCTMKHSENVDRQNIPGYNGYAGENLAWTWSWPGAVASSMSKYGRLSAESWYSEMKYYQYGGASKSFDSCPMRNKDGREQIGHLTQMMWQSTTEIGCDWALCTEGQAASTIVTCVYGPGGNMIGQAAFDEAAYQKLNAWPENQQKYGGLPRC